jgi:hypothetical protein
VQIGEEPTVLAEASMPHSTKKAGGSSTGNAASVEAVCSGVEESAPRVIEALERHGMSASLMLFPALQSDGNQ